MNSSNTCPTGNCGCNPDIARPGFLKLAGIVVARSALPNLYAIAGPFDAVDFAHSQFPAAKKLSAACLHSLTERGAPTVCRGADLMA